MLNCDNLAPAKALSIYMHFALIIIKCLQITMLTICFMQKNCKIQFILSLLII